jgi:DNA-binding transcriptional regulator LsrR (DeoR family)
MDRSLSAFLPATPRRSYPPRRINYSFFAEDGTTAPEWNIFPALGVAQAQAMVKAQKTAVVAAGRYKMAALRAALRGRLFNVLITDEMAAKELLGGD